MLEVEKVVSFLREEYADWVKDLPLFTRSSRDAALFVWYLAYVTEDYTSLPTFWRNMIGVFFSGLTIQHELLRRGSFYVSRSSEVDAFCFRYLEKLWEQKGRKTVFVTSRVCWNWLGFDQCYDCLWTVWDNLKDMLCKE